MKSKKFREDILEQVHNKGSIDNYIWEFYPQTKVHTNILIDLFQQCIQKQGYEIIEFNNKRQNKLVAICVKVIKNNPTTNLFNLMTLCVPCFTTKS